MNRLQLRQSLRNKRRTLSSIEQKAASAQLITHLSSHTVFKSAQHIAAYIAHDGEIDPRPLLELAWQQNKICYLPILDPQKPGYLCFASYFSNDALILNQYNIPEPPYNSDKIIAPAELDLVLLPLVGFDKHGNRLGMGAGFYDRTFVFLNTSSRPTQPYLLGIAYDWQQLETITAESWDVKLDGIATENGVITCTTG